MHPLQPLLDEAVKVAIEALMRVCIEGSPTQARLAATRILSLRLSDLDPKEPATDSPPVPRSAPLEALSMAAPHNPFDAPRAHADVPFPANSAAGRKQRAAEMEHFAPGTLPSNARRAAV